MPVPLAGSGSASCASSSSEHEVVGARVASLGDERPAVAPVVEHPFGDRQLLFGGRLPPGEGPAVDAPRLDQRVVGRREPDEPEHDLGGQRERQRLDVFGRRPLVDHPVEQGGGALAHVVLERTQPAVGEALAGVDADPGVVGFGPVRHDGHGVEVVRRQDGRGVGREREDRILHVRRREDVRVHEDRLDVGHRGDDHVAEFGRVEDRGARRGAR